MTGRAVLALALALPSAAAALPLQLPPQAALTAETTEAGSDTPVPTAVWGAFEPPEVRMRGTVTRSAWRIGTSSLTTLQIIEPLRAQLVAAGLTPVFECVDTDCGGFDFRFSLDLIGEPDMHVDLGDYRYLVATRTGDAGTEAVALVASRSRSAGFLHMTHVQPEAAATAAPVALPDAAPEIVPEAGRGDPPAPVAPVSDLIATLESSGRAVLGDLVFRTGASDLDDGPFPSLDALAAYLKARPDLSVVLVGHTDATGTLSANVELSRARALAVLDRLATVHDVPRERMQADGVGFLMPMARNDTEDGRRLNRRVEAVLIPPT